MSFQPTTATVFLDQNRPHRPRGAMADHGHTRARTHCCPRPMEVEVPPTGMDHTLRNHKHSSDEDRTPMRSPTGPQSRALRSAQSRGLAPGPRQRRRRAWFTAHMVTGTLKNTLTRTTLTATELATNASQPARPAVLNLLVRHSRRLMERPEHLRVVRRLQSSQIRVDKNRPDAATDRPITTITMPKTKWLHRWEATWVD